MYRIGSVFLFITIRRYSNSPIYDFIRIFCLNCAYSDEGFRLGFLGAHSWTSFEVEVEYWSLDVHDMHDMVSFEMLTS